MTPTPPPDDLDLEAFLLPGPGPRPAWLESTEHPRITERRRRVILEKIADAEHRAALAEDADEDA